MKEFDEQAIQLHETFRGKLEITSKIPLATRDDLSLAYSPGVAAPCREIRDAPERAYDLTVKRNSVAVVTDGSSVLGLGNIGPLAALPVMEGKAILFKKYAGVDAWPICLECQDAESIIATCKRIAPGFGAINLEDIAAPKCFQIEDALQDIGIPVLHDDQHGTAIVALAAIINAARVVGKRLSDLRVVIVGAGAAGTAIAKILHRSSYDEGVKDVIMCDSKGAISRDRQDLSPVKQALLGFTNIENSSGTLQDVLGGADLFIGVSQPNLITGADVARMAKDPIILALANPIPEIHPEEARKGGAAIIGTGRSDLPNQVNNVLAFPGLFRGALDARAKRFTGKMKIAAAKALAEVITDPTPELILPNPLDPTIGTLVSKAVFEAATTTTA